jgi:glyoxylase-like metal-dependent hydrolase (beta-lactamase superfamily II)
VTGVSDSSGRDEAAKVDGGRERLWEVTIATYGRRHTVRSDVFLNHHLYGEPDGPIGMDYFVWVLRSGTDTIVVDTGFSPSGGAARGRELLVQPRELFDALDVDPAAGPTVVVTHAHYDHIGSLDLFSESPVVLARRELEFWTGPMAEKLLFRHSVDTADLDELTRVVRQGRAVLFDDRYRLAPGIELIEVGGHTPGQSMVLVDTADGRVLLTSDAMHYYEELDREMPFTSVVDIAGMYAAFERIKELVASGSVRHVVSGHDPDTLRRLIPEIDPDQTMATIGGRTT